MTGSRRGATGTSSPIQRETTSSKEARIIERFGAAADHPVALNFPEGDYLKGLLVARV